MIIMVIVITMVIIKISLLLLYHWKLLFNFFTKHSMDAFKSAPSCLPLYHSLSFYPLVCYLFIYLVSYFYLSLIIIFLFYQFFICVFF